MGTADSPLPRLGLGTWQNTEFEQCQQSVRTALDIGYRHIDTAELYENEAAVGAGIDAAAVDREDVVLATKVLHPRTVDGDLTREKLRAMIDGCLRRLDVDVVDVMYVHWPADYDLQLVHTTLAELRDDGRIHAVGVSNYEPGHIETALEVDPAIIANQVELHPLLQQPDLRAFCDEVGVDVVAYAPLAHGNVFSIAALQEIADNHDVSVAHVTLAWLHENGVAAVPKATSEAHIRDNWASQDLSLSADEIGEIEAIEQRERFFDPDYAPDWE